MSLDKKDFVAVSLVSLFPHVDHLKWQTAVSFEYVKPINYFGVDATVG